MASAYGRAELVGTIEDRTPLVELGLIVPAGVVLEKVVVDTGFEGALRVPSGFFRAHGIRWRSTMETLLADGKTKGCYPMASVTIQWLGEALQVAALEFGHETLVGMELLNHSRIELDGEVLKLSRL